MEDFPEAEAACTVNWLAAAERGPIGSLHLAWDRVRRASVGERELAPPAAAQ